MLYTVEQVKEITDNPADRVITAYFYDGASVIIKNISYEKYSLPPGYKVKNATLQEMGPLMTQRQILYYTSLSAQLINT